MRLQQFIFNPLDEPLPKRNGAAKQEPEEPKVEEPPPPPTFSEEELKKTKDEGYRQGYSEGKEAGRNEANTKQAELAQHTSKMVQQLCSEVSAMGERHQAAFRQQCSEVSKLVIAAARQVAGEAMDKAPIAAIETMINQCLHVMIEEPRVTLHVHPDLAESAEKEIKQRLKQAGYDGAIIIETDENIALGDGRIDWRNGSAERSQDKIWHEIERIIQQFQFGEVSKQPESIKQHRQQEEEYLPEQDAGEEEEIPMTKAQSN